MINAGVRLAAIEAAKAKEVRCRISAVISATLLCVCSVRFRNRVSRQSKGTPHRSILLSLHWADGRSLSARVGYVASHERR